MSSAIEKGAALISFPSTRWRHRTNDVNFVHDLRFDNVSGIFSCCISNTFENEYIFFRPNEDSTTWKTRKGINVSIQKCTKSSSEEFFFIILTVIFFNFQESASQNAKLLETIGRTREHRKLSHYFLGVFQLQVLTSTSL